MPADQPPQINPIVGTARATLAPSRYPEFSSYSSNNPACGEYLKKRFSDGGMSLAPLWAASSQGDGTTALAADPGYQQVPQLTTTIAIPAQYQTTTKLMITWTVRMETETPASYAPAPRLCSVWSGSSTQTFWGGEVNTRLFVNGSPMGPIATLTIPGSATGTNSQVFPPPPPPAPPRSRDPTLTGSHVLEKTSFPNNRFPDSLTLEIRWQNDTCLRIVSPENMRSLIITFVPL